MPYAKLKQISQRIKKNMQRRTVAGVKLHRFNSRENWRGVINGRAMKFGKRPNGKWVAMFYKDSTALPCVETTLRRAVTCAKTYTYK